MRVVSFLEAFLPHSVTAPSSMCALTLASPVLAAGADSSGERASNFLALDCSVGVEESQEDVDTGLSPLALLSALLSLHTQVQHIPPLSDRKWPHCSVSTVLASIQQQFRSSAYCRWLPTQLMVTVNTEGCSHCQLHQVYSRMLCSPFLHIRLACVHFPLSISSSTPWAA